MRKVTWFKFVLTVLAIASSFAALAQNSFKYKADLEKVSQPGFYKISLSPDVLSKSRADLADVRIADKKGQQIPYIFGSTLPAINNVSLLPVIADNSGTDTTASFIVGNEQGYSLNHLVLQLRNTEVKRTLNLSGSDDSKKWYAIKENIPLEPPSAAQGNGSYEQLLNFPLSTYKYFRVDINSNRKLPVEISAVKIYQWQHVKPSYAILPAALVNQRDSNRTSYVELKFRAKYAISKILLNAVGVKFYNRTVNVFDDARSLIYTGIINSSNPAELIFSIKTDKLYLEIENHDNPALKIESVNAWQLDQELISYIEPGNDYHLLFGDEKAMPPDYDLSFFTDSVTRRPVTVLKHLKVTADNIAKQPVVSNKLPQWLLWAAIAAAAVILLTLTLKMTKEVNKRS